MNLQFNLGIFELFLTWAEKIVDGCFALIPQRKPGTTAAKKTCLIAHRGAYNNQGIVENTLVAFKLAQESGCWGIEFDVHMTADDVLVVNHDPTLNRLWGKDLAIAELTFVALRELVPSIPSLAEVVAEFGGQMHLFIELKVPVKEEGLLIHCLQKLSPGKDYHLLTLNPRFFNTIFKLPSSSLLLVAGHNNVKTFCDLSIKKQFGGVMGNYLLLSNKRIKQLKAAQQLYGIGFVNSQNSLYRELNRGIAWIFSNEVVKVSQYLKDLRGE